MFYYIMSKTKVMKKLLTIALGLLLMNSYAQTNRNLVLLSATNEAMEVMINNRPINHRPLKDVRITGLQDNYYDVAIRMANQPRIIIRGHLYVPPMSEIVYEVFAPDRRSNRGEFIIKDVYPADNQTPYYQQESVFSWGNNGISTQGNNGQNNQNGQINININNSSTAGNQGGQGAPVVYVPDYTGAVGCVPPVTANRFSNMLQVIENETFEAGKLRVAKQIIKTNQCLTVNQLVQILRLFDFDESRLKLAKFAYDYSYDLENYYKVNAVFDFESNKRKLDAYIQNKN